MQLCSASCLVRPWGGSCSGRRCLVTESRAGNRAAQEILFAAISRFVHREAAALCRHGDQAEDLAQSALLLTFERLDQLRCAQRLRPWVKAIVLNAHRAVGRRMLTTPSRVEPLTESSSTDRPEPVSGLDAGRLLEAVLRGIQTLPPSSRDAFELRVVQGKSTAEAALALRISQEAVRTRLARARRVLRRLVEEAST